MPKCKCGTQIVFIQSPEGYVTPCDPLPVLYWSNPRGVGRIVTADGRCIAATSMAIPSLHPALD